MELFVLMIVEHADFRAGSAFDLDRDVVETVKIFFDAGYVDASVATKTTLSRTPMAKERL